MTGPLCCLGFLLAGIANRAWCLRYSRVEWLGSAIWRHFDKESSQDHALSIVLCSLCLRCVCCILLSSVAIAQAEVLLAIMASSADDLEKRHGCMLIYIHVASIHSMVMVAVMSRFIGLGKPSLHEYVYHLY